MAKFCTKCGKALDKCTCENKSKKSSKVNVVTDQGIVNNIISIVKDIFKKPFDTISGYVNLNDTKLALILMLINSLLFGVFCYFYADNAMKSVVNSVNSSLSSLGSLGSIASSSLNSEMQNVQLPFITVLLCGTIIMFLAFIVLSLMAKLFMGVIFKGNYTIREYINLHGIASVISSVVMVVAIICSFISIKLAMLVLIAGAILYFVSVIHSYISIKLVNSERLSYSVALTILSTYIISVFIGIFVISCFLASYYV